MHSGLYGLIQLVQLRLVTIVLLMLQDATSRHIEWMNLKHSVDLT